MKRNVYNLLLEECMNDWHATGHPDASLALEAVHHLKDYINECSY